MHATHSGYLGNHVVDGGAWCLRVSDSPTRELPRTMQDTIGYYIDEYGDEEYRPIVVQLPHGRFLPGYTMGLGMITSFDASSVLTDEREAWMRAHQVAEWDATLEREYQASRCTECFDNEKRGSGELPDLCESCYADSPERTLAHHGWE